MTIWRGEGMRLWPSVLWSERPANSISLAGVEPGDVPGRALSDLASFITAGE
jgi:hypothetical protein